MSDLEVVELLKKEEQGIRDNAYNYCVGDLTEIALQAQANVLHRVINMIQREMAK